MIYFVQPQGRPFVKIGYARHVWERCLDLQIASPDELILLGVLPGDFAKETLVHERLKHLHVRGEWFRYTKEVRDFIRAHAVEYQPEVHDPAPKSAAEAEAWKTRLASVRSVRQGKRLRVWVQQFNDRASLMLQWIDPETGRRKSMSAGTMDRDEAEQRRADLEAELNRQGSNGSIFIKRNSSRNSEQMDQKEADEANAANDDESDVYG